MVIDRKIPTPWRTAEMLSQKNFSSTGHLSRFVLHQWNATWDISSIAAKYSVMGSNTRRQSELKEKHRCCSILQLMNGLVCSAGACPTLCGHQGSSQLCAIPAATFYFSLLWCFPPFCCFEFCCCYYKTCSFSHCLCPSGPRLPGRMMAGTLWHSLVGTKALQDKAKSGLPALQSLSITALEPVSTSQ